MRFLKLKDIKILKKFIYNNWSKNHIFTKSDRLIKWQHSSYKNRLDFYVVIKNNNILSLLGIINQSRDSQYSEISLAIWLSKQKSLGSKLFLSLEKKFSFKTIKGTTVNKKIIPMYKLLGFSVKKFNIYYLKPLSKIKQTVSKNLIMTKINKKENLKYLKLSEFIKNKNINLKYLKWRFLNHPVYKYHFISDKQNDLIIIFRVIKIKNLKIMRVVDFLGTFKEKKIFIKKLNFYLYSNNFEYLEFFHYGYEDKFISKSGLKILNKKQKIAVYTEPFKNLTNDDFYCCYKTKKNMIKIVRADGDFDRPSVI
ncbi:hypothetical protein OAL68_01790 [Candidatus Pelagibacter sp.]|nr:hypothetical protein [Candidatus Pelagibacter sp.]